MVPRIGLDLETTSRVDLRKVGAYRYAQDPSTRVIVSCVRDPDTGEASTLPNNHLTGRWANKLDAGALVVAHNAAFERAIWKYILHPKMGWPPCPPLDRWRDTMAQALYFGLPGKLEQAAEILKLPAQKDTLGHRLMLQMARPRKVDPDGTVHWWHEESPEKLTRLQSYCAADVEATLALHARLPALPLREEAIWRLDQHVNDGGVGLDVGLIDRMRVLAKDALDAVNAEIAQLTQGAVTKVTQVSALMCWLRAEGFPVQSLQQPSIEKELTRTDLSPAARRALELRLLGARGSVAKLDSLTAYCSTDAPVARGLLQHYGASRTGRWAGRGPQPHNLPRPARGLDVDLAVSLIKKGADVRQLAMFTGHDAMTVLSGCLRGCFVAPGDDMVLLSADYSQIEARMGAYLADEDAVLEVFARKEDLYVSTARDLGSDDRQFGKLMALSCQYQTGGPKLQVTAESDYGLIMTEDEARNAVADWRTARPNIVGTWWQLDDIAKRAIQHPDRWHPVANKAGMVICEFQFKRGALYLRLMSGRMLCYQQAALAPHPKFNKQSVTYWGQDQTTKRWVRTWAYGGMWFNNLVQGSSRDVMADAMMQLSRSNPGNDPLVRLLLTVHDELIGAAKRGLAKRALAYLLGVMESGSSWCPGLPLAAGGYIAERFRKG